MTNTFSSDRPSPSPVKVSLLISQRLAAELSNKEKHASKLSEHLDFEKVCNCFTTRKTEVPDNIVKASGKLQLFTTLPLSTQDNLKTTEELSRILDSTRSHLVNQLEQSEAEKVRLAAQIQVWERRFHNNTLQSRNTNN